METFGFQFDVFCLFFLQLLPKKQLQKTQNFQPSNFKPNVSTQPPQDRPEPIESFVLLSVLMLFEKVHSDP